MIAMLQKITRRPVLLSLMALLCACVAPAQAQEAAPDLKRGVNIVGYDPLWNDPAQARFQPRHMQAIKDGGFDHVRMNLQAFAHMDKDGQLSAAWLKTLDALVDTGLKAGLQVILDEHDFEACAKELTTCRARLQSFWQQIALHYKDAPAGVIFEILNEPNGAMNEAWNDVLAENLAIIRASNPTRRVVIGPRMWNSLGELDKLKLPADDRHIVVTFHYYTPMEFTHQGASWTPEFTKLSGVTWGTGFDRDRLTKDFAQVAAWAERNKRPILLGEFGALESAGTAQRVVWTDAVARTAEAQGFGWAYWQFDSNFIVWDMSRDGWVNSIHGALIPEQADPTIKAAVQRAIDPAMQFVINTPRARHGASMATSRPTSRWPATLPARAACVWTSVRGCRMPGTWVPSCRCWRTSARATSCVPLSGRASIPMTPRRRRPSRSCCNWAPRPTPAWWRVRSL